MRIDELVGQGKPTTSFEFYPPTTELARGQLRQAMTSLAELSPDYVSVTYGPGEETRRGCVELVKLLQADRKARVMPHLSCLGHTKEQVTAALDVFWEAGVRNVLAVRGDPPQGVSQFAANDGELHYANELVEFVRQRYDFCIAVAAHPEGHPQCLNLTRDMEHLKRKVDAGASFIVTQLFFDNNEFYRFRDAARRMGISVPLVTTIMPIQDAQHVKRFAATCRVSIPNPLLVQIEQAEANPQALRRLGIDQAVRQCQDLLANGVDGLHFYTLNSAQAVTEICRAL